MLIVIPLIVIAIAALYAEGVYQDARRLALAMYMNGHVLKSEHFSSKRADKKAEELGGCVFVYGKFIKMYWVMVDEGWN